MRRLRHIIIIAATVLSLLLCAATIVLWVGSYSAELALALDRYRVPTDWQDLAVAGYAPGDVGWNLRRELTAYHGTFGVHLRRLCRGEYIVPDGPPPTVGWHLDVYVESDPDPRLSSIRVLDSSGTAHQQ